MLFVEPGGDGEKDLEDAAVFLSQLAALGVPAAIHARSLAPPESRTLQFDLAPFVRDTALREGDRVVLLGAQRMTDATIRHLRRLGGGLPAVPSTAFGRFGSRQRQIGAAARIAYALGCEPDMVDLAGAAADDESRGAPVLGAPRQAPPDGLPRVLLMAPPLDDRAQARALRSLAVAPGFRTTLITDGRSKSQWLEEHGPEIDIYQYGEALPAGLAERTEVLVCFAALPGYYRVQCLLANAAASGVALIDATDGHLLSAAADAFIRGPLDLVGLGPFLTSSILPNLGEIGDRVRRSRYAAARQPGPVLAALGAAAPPPPAPRPSPSARRRVVFMPTNGVGLGHAQRCTLVAGGLDQDRIAPVFAAFPSCLPMIRGHGFDVMPLIGRSGRHAEPHANDLPNYLRLRALTEGASALVFDGGYVFDSVCRAIFDNRLRGIWIRRGLWQADQRNVVPLDREKVFDRVIVPLEAFDELNVAYSRTPAVREVGPVVQRVALGADGRRELRAGLAERFSSDFEHLVITQLGGGVASDRSGQIQAICGMLERRSDVLHLVVVWPNAVVHPAWFGWTRSRIVRTQRAAVVAAAADVCITAAGYNSFHEVLYNALPAIFVPQTSSSLDDQPARAAAAADRGLAVSVGPHEMLKLEGAVDRLLGGDAAALRARLAAEALPEPGATAAAHLIAEVTDADGTLERAAAASHARGRRGHR